MKRMRIGGDRFNADFFFTPSFTFLMLLNMEELEGGGGNGVHSTEVEFSLLNQRPRVQLSHLTASNF